MSEENKTFGESNSFTAEQVAFLKATFSEVIEDYDKNIKIHIAKSTVPFYRKKEFWGGFCAVIVIALIFLVNRYTSDKPLLPIMLHDIIGTDAAIGTELLSENSKSRKASKSILETWILDQNNDDFQHLLQKTIRSKPILGFHEQGFLGPRVTGIISSELCSSIDYQSKECFEFETQSDINLPFYGRENDEIFLILSIEFSKYDPTENKDPIPLKNKKLHGIQIKVDDEVLAERPRIENKGSSIFHISLHDKKPIKNSGTSNYFHALNISFNQNNFKSKIGIDSQEFSLVNAAVTALLLVNRPAIEG